MKLRMDNPSLNTINNHVDTNITTKLSSRETIEQQSTVVQQVAVRQ